MTCEHGAVAHYAGPALSHTPRAGSVAIARGPRRYDADPPFSPTIAYPEYPFDDATAPAENGSVYDAVRNSLALLKLDAEHLGTAGWNPLRETIRPGDTVVLKPNFVRDFRETQDGDGRCIITNGTIIRAVVDYVYLALGGEGRIIIADAPQNDANFDRIRELTAVDAIRGFYQERTGFDVELYDLRPEQARKVDGVIVGHTPLPGDPAGYTRVNLGGESALTEVNHLCHLLYGAEYNTKELFSHHHDDLHEYLISKTILNADVVISLPKLKTHKKVGLTVNLKNLVGINGNKNWLPHHREGTPAQGGDQFCDDHVKHRVERAMAMQFKRVFPLLGPLRRIVAGPIKALGKRLFGDTNTDTIRSGNWYGNDTCWRMVVDLNRILFYADAAGFLHEHPVRRFVSIVDGIIAGEGNGPLDPKPKPTGLVIAGLNPVAVDLACARVMGFDPRRIPMLTGALADHPRPLTAFGDYVTGLSDEPGFVGPIGGWRCPHAAFEPHFGWKGHIEHTA